MKQCDRSLDVGIQTASVSSYTKSPKCKLLMGIALLFISMPAISSANPQLCFDNILSGVCRINVNITNLSASDYTVRTTGFANVSPVAGSTEVTLAANSGVGSIQFDGNYLNSFPAVTNVEYDLAAKQYISGKPYGDDITFKLTSNTAQIRPYGSYPSYGYVIFDNLKLPNVSCSSGFPVDPALEDGQVYCIITDPPSSQAKN